MIAIKAANICKEYKGKSILQLDLDFQEGGLHAILGPNGSGKSTLLRLLALLEEPDSGEIIVSDNNGFLKKTMATRRKIVLVPDRQGLFNSTVSENVRYGLRVRKISKDKQEKIIADVLNDVGLWEFRHENSLVLSSGESQRLCLAMALAVQARIILLDEPTSSLDPRNTDKVEKIILAMKNRSSLIVLVTHDVGQARRLADRVIFISGGRIKDQGSADAFFGRYKDENY